MSNLAVQSLVQSLPAAGPPAGAGLAGPPAGALGEAGGDFVAALLALLETGQAGSAAANPAAAGGLPLVATPAVVVPAAAASLESPTLARVAGLIADIEKKFGAGEAPDAETIATLEAAIAALIETLPETQPPAPRPAAAPELAALEPVEPGPTAPEPVAPDGGPAAPEPVATGPAAPELGAPVQGAHEQSLVAALNQRVTEAGASEPFKPMPRGRDSFLVATVSQRVPDAPASAATLAGRPEPVAPASSAVLESPPAQPASPPAPVHAGLAPPILVPRLSGPKTAVSSEAAASSEAVAALAEKLAAVAPVLAGKLEALATKLATAGRAGSNTPPLASSDVSASPAPVTLTPPGILLAGPVPTAAAPTGSGAAAPKAALPAAAVVNGKPAPPASGVRAATAATNATVKTAPEAEPRPAPVEVVRADIRPEAPPVALSSGIEPLTSTRSAPVQALPAAYQPPAHPINMGQLGFEIAHQNRQGNARFTIRLDPPELGRVDVRLQIDPQGAVTAHLSVDRLETLDMFHRDQRALEKALMLAGLDANKTNLEFSLNKQGQNNSFGALADDARQGQSRGEPAASPSHDGTNSDEQAPVPAVTLYRGTISAGGVNIFV